MVVGWFFQIITGFKWRYCSLGRQFTRYRRSRHKNTKQQAYDQCYDTQVTGKRINSKYQRDQYKKPQSQIKSEHPKMAAAWGWVLRQGDRASIEYVFH